MKLGSQVSLLINKSAASRYFKINRQVQRLILEGWRRRGRGRSCCWRQRNILFGIVGATQTLKRERRRRELQTYRFFLLSVFIAPARYLELRHYLFCCLSAICSCFASRASAALFQRGSWLCEKWALCQMPILKINKTSLVSFTERWSLAAGVLLQGGGRFALDSFQCSRLLPVLPFTENMVVTSSL